MPVDKYWQRATAPEFKRSVLGAEVHLVEYWEVYRFWVDGFTLASSVA